MELQVNSKVPTLTILGGKIEGSPISSHVAWLRQGDEERPKSKNLQQKFTASGVTITEVDPDSSDVIAFPNADLIIVEYYGYFQTDLPSLLHYVRANSYAPVVMLTDNQTFEWSSAAIAAGADAIVTVATADEVIMARCQALLRRWRSSR